MTENVRVLPIAGYDGIYSVSSLGGVFSHRRNRHLKPYDSKGYSTVGLKLGGNRKNLKVHLLVASAFHGPRPGPGIECAHLDGDVTNNAASNLAWVTKAENEAHKRQHGTARVGELSHHAKLTNEQAAIVRSALLRPLKRRELAILTGLSGTSICGIINGDSYNGASAHRTEGLSS